MLHNKNNAPSAFVKKLKTSKPFWMQREGKMLRPSELHSTLNRKKADPTLLEYETR